MPAQSPVADLCTTLQSAAGARAASARQRRARSKQSVSCIAELDCLSGRFLIPRCMLTPTEADRALFSAAPSLKVPRYIYVVQIPNSIRAICGSVRTSLSHI